MGRLHCRGGEASANQPRLSNGVFKIGAARIGLADLEYQKPLCHQSEIGGPWIGETAAILPVGDFLIRAETIHQLAAEYFEIAGVADEGEFAVTITEERVQRGELIVEMGFFLGEQAAVILQNLSAPGGEEFETHGTACLIPKKHLPGPGDEPDKAFAAEQTDAEARLVKLEKPLWMEWPGIADDDAADVARWIFTGFIGSLPCIGRGV